MAATHIRTVRGRAFTVANPRPRRGQVRSARRVIHARALSKIRLKGARISKAQGPAPKGYVYGTDDVSHALASYTGSYALFPTKETRKRQAAETRARRAANLARYQAANRKRLET